MKQDEINKIIRIKFINKINLTKKKANHYNSSDPAINFSNNFYIRLVYYL